MNTAILAAINTNQIPAGLAPVLVLLVPLIIAIAIWDAVWKAIAMWKSARNDQLGWFVCIVIFNTAGILPILYILLFQKKHMPNAPMPM